MRIDATIRGRRINHWWTGAAQWYRSRRRRRSVVQRAVRERMNEWTSIHVHAGRHLKLHSSANPKGIRSIMMDLAGMQAASTLTCSASRVNECGPHLIESLDSSRVRGSSSRKERTSSRSRQHQHHQHHQRQLLMTPFCFCFSICSISLIY